MKNYILRANNMYVLVRDHLNPCLPCFWSTDIETYRPIILNSWEQAKKYWEYLKQCKEYYSMNRNLGETFSIAICEIEFVKCEEWEEEL